MHFASLALDVRLDDIERCPAARHRAIAWAPEMLTPQLFPDFGEVQFSQPIGRRTFQAIDQGGDGHFWRISYKKVNVIVLAVEFEQLGLEILTDFGHGFL